MIGFTLSAISSRFSRVGAPFRVTAGVGGSTGRGGGNGDAFFWPWGSWWPTGRTGSNCPPLPIRFRDWEMVSLYSGGAGTWAQPTAADAAITSALRASEVIEGSFPDRHSLLGRYPDTKHTLPRAEYRMSYRDLNT